MTCKALLFRASLSWIAYLAVVMPASGKTLTVALSGQLAPGTSANYVDWRNLPVIGSDGTVTFLARTTAGIGPTDQKQAVFQGAPHRIQLVVDSDTPTSTGEPGFLGWRHHLTVNERGDFLADDRSYGFFKVTGVTLSAGGIHNAVAYRGSAVPASSYSFGMLSIPTLTNSGIVSFFAEVVDSSNVNRGEGLWSTAVGPLWLEAGNQRLTGSTIAGFAGSGIPGAANDGRQVFLSDRYVSLATVRPGIFTRASSGFSPFAERGDAAPGTAGRFHNLRTPVTNGAGKFAFASTLSGATLPTDAGIWASTASGLRLVARKGSPAPGTAGTFAALDLTDNLNLNAQGNLLIAANLNLGGAPQERGLWLDSAAGLSLIAVEGSRAPGVGRYFNRVFDGANLNDGTVIFGAAVSSVPNDPNGQFGIWRWTAGQIERIVGVGDRLEVLPGDFRTINRLEFAYGTQNEDGRGLCGANGNGEVVFSAWFNDGSTGIFVHGSKVPEPTTQLSTITFVVACVLQRKERRPSRRVSLARR